ncbi:calcium-dependent lipid-binding family protein [Striga asiatica]|uniref:Calcium-dependent lipid-binding family protein n=1 Tax=Striga asiatica TaxID=4170 RepID=A0A5A7PJ30_STRAF|nr:calcium-dependent lipid-binding family protein [Striga asiatica]
MKKQRKSSTRDDDERIVDRTAPQYLTLMDSPQSVVSPLKTHPPRENMEINFQSKDIGAHEDEDNRQLATLDVYIHHARDIHNICIYQKQDVYAKLCLTSHPENSVSTKIIHGGGHNPVFDESLRLTVRTPNSSLKCEIWMLSRVRNYMEDQLLGFALVPLSEILLQGGSKLRKEFSLSSTDLFHSPAGFVELSVSYVGAHPDVIAITAPVLVVPENESIASLVNEFDRMEFPDPKVANENHKMVEEYIEICSTKPGESLSAGSELKANSSASASASASAEVSSESDEKTSKEPVLGPEEKPEEKISENGLDDAKSGGGGDVKPLVSVNQIESEPKLVQQDIVDMYMKSMQQFTVSLAKMKLPMDYENGPSSSENSTTSDQKTPTSKNSGSRVFYGSRAFF